MGWPIGGTTVAFLALLSAMALIAPSAGARGGAIGPPALALSWLAPTPSDGKTYTVAVGSRLRLELAASAEGGPTDIWASGLAAGAGLPPNAGAPADAGLGRAPGGAPLWTHIFVFSAGPPKRPLATQPAPVFLPVGP